MIARFAAFLLLVYTLGFAWFAGALPQPMTGGTTDGVIVPTGASGRIARGLEVVSGEEARVLLVTGVDPEVTPEVFAEEFDVPPAVMDCCLTLGFRAVDTRSNASEAADWVEKENVASVRLVTSDWHMRRAARALREALPGSVAVVEDAVASQPSLRILFLEYNKWLLGGISRLGGLK